MDNDILKKLQEFIEKERWKYKFELKRDVKLYEDLRIYGDDAVNFIIKFGKEFNVDVSNFMMADYFKGEGIDILGPITSLIRRKTQPQLKILTIGDLEKAIKAGKLDEEIIDN